MYLTKMTRPSTLVAFVLVGSSVTGHTSAADPEDNNPLGIWKGSNNSHLKGTFKAEVAYFDQGNSWFGKGD